VTARPRPVRDVEAEDRRGTTTLRWTNVPGAEVRIYATPGTAAPPGAEDTDADPARPGPPPLRFVGSSRRGRLVDADAAGEIVYTPLTVDGTRAVWGRPLRHVAMETVRDLRADDRGSEIVLRFGMPPGVTEARIAWRRDRPPTGPDDPAAATAKVTNTALEIRGGWSLPAPRDGFAYFFAIFPLRRAGGTVTPVPVGSQLQVRTASSAGTPPPARPIGRPPRPVRPLHPVRRHRPAGATRRDPAASRRRPPPHGPGPPPVPDRRRRRRRRGRPGGAVRPVRPRAVCPRPTRCRASGGASAPCASR